VSVPQRLAKQRSPSNLGSKSHPLREKGCATSVASMGETHWGHPVLPRALALADNSRIRLGFAISLGYAYITVQSRTFAGHMPPVLASGRPESHTICVRSVALKRISSSSCNRQSGRDVAGHIIGWRPYFIC